VTVADDRIVNNERTLDVRVDAKPGAWWLLLNRSPAGTPVTLTEVGGIAPEGGGRKPEPFRSVNAIGAAGNPITVRLKTSPTAALRFTFYDSIGELPSLPLPPRPSWIVRGSEGRLFNDASTSCRAVSVGAAATTGVASH
jgi:hypothetical protein